jgi:hypothetical protein
VVLGTRQRRYGSLVTGIVFVLVAAALGWSAIRGVDPYPYYPFVYIFYKAEQADSRALSEINRRLSKGILTKRQIDKLADAALDKQADCEDFKDLEWIDILQRLDERELLSEVQRQRYYEQLATDFTFEVRERVRPGQPIPGEVSYRGCRPTVAAISTELDNMSLAADETVIPSSQWWKTYWSTGLHIQDHLVEILLREELSAGLHEITFHADLKHYGGLSICPKKVVLTDHFEVVANPEDADVKLTSDPQLKRQLERLIRTGISILGYQEPTPDGKDAFIAFHFKTGAPLPVAVAFDVHYRTGEEEYDCGSLWCERHSTDFIFDDALPIDISEITQGEVILRSNPEIALLTVDIWEIWDGQLVFKPVTVGPSTRTQYRSLLQAAQP